MKRLVLAAAFATLGITAVLAQSDPIAARKAIMKENGNQSRIAREMIEGKQPFNLDAAKKVLTTFGETADKAKNLWPDNSKTGGDTAADSLELTPGATVDLPNGWGTITWEEVTAEEPVKRFASLQIQRDPSSGWVLAFSVLATLGLLAERVARLGADGSPLRVVSAVPNSEGTTVEIVDDAVLDITPPSEPGTAPRTRIRPRSTSTFTTCRFCVVTRTAPMWPAIFLPLNTLPGSWHWPVEPCERWLIDTPCEARRPPKLCRFIAPAKPLPIEVPAMSTN